MSKPAKIAASKRCSRCDVDKPINAFALVAGCKYRRSRRCLDCQAEIKETPKNRRKQLKQYNGMTPRQYANMLVAQDHRCAICLKPQDKPYVDHCHRTQIVRGLLYLDCNLGIGLLGDSPELARRAAAYLAKHRR